MNDRALDHPLKACRRLHICAAVRVHDRGQLCLDIIQQAGTQFVDIHLAGRQDLKRVTILDQRQQQMFQRRKLVVAIGGIAHCTAQRFFEFT